ncbi:hypothetical protein ABK040_013194 [Willaertia magna]
MNERVKDIYSSKTEYMIISNINNEFFVSGSNEDKMFGMLDYCKELYKDCFYFDKFTKLKSYCNKYNGKYLYPIILFYSFYIVVSDYKLLKEVEDEENEFGLNCLQKLQNGVYCDIEILFKNLKKRKRFF